MLADELNITPKGLAVISTAGGRETLCYEYDCDSPDGCKLVIYADAMTGQQRQISLLCEDDRGTRAV
jgi:hypothetical protein